jgi:hypothetical protein
MKVNIIPTKKLAIFPRSFCAVMLAFSSTGIAARGEESAL